MAAGGRKSEYGRNWSVLEFPGPGRAASAARKVRAPLARPRALGTLRSPGTAASGIARMWSLRRWLSTSRWGLRTGNGFKITKEKRTVRGSFQGLGEVCSPSSARGVAQSPPPSGSWKPDLCATRWPTRPAPRVFLGTKIASLTFAAGRSAFPGCPVRCAVRMTGIRPFPMLMV